MEAKHDTGLLAVAVAFCVGLALLAVVSVAWGANEWSPSPILGTSVFTASVSRDAYDGVTFGVCTTANAVVTSCNYGSITCDSGSVESAYISPFTGSTYASASAINAFLTIGGDFITDGSTHGWCVQDGEGLPSGEVVGSDCFGASCPTPTPTPTPSATASASGPFVSADYVPLYWYLWAFLFFGVFFGVVFYFRK